MSERKYQSVSVLGLGYIGLPTAAVLAARKIHVLGVDVNQQVVDTINRGQVHIVEPDLDIVVNASLTQGYLKASTVPQPADAFLISVPTPFTKDHTPDLSFVEAATRSIAPVLKRGDLVVLESTSPIGTTQKISTWLAELRSDLNFPSTGSTSCDVHIAHCPERVLPGHVLTELIQNDRVIGGITPACSQAAMDLYRLFVEAEILITNARTAEMCKLVENSFRDVNIAFANELSLICDKSDVDVWELIKLANHHPRVNILQPGPGVGGHCIAVDPWFLISHAPDTAKLIRAAREVNDFKPRYVVETIRTRAKELGINSVTLYGLAFKPNIDDLRESPAVQVAVALAGTELDIQIVEPNITCLPDTLSNSSCELVRENQVTEGSLEAFLVAHSEFTQYSRKNNSLTLDFCGVLTSLR